MNHIIVFVKSNIMYFKEVWRRSKLYLPYRLFLALSYSGILFIGVVFPKYFLDPITEEKNFAKALVILGIYLGINFIYDIVTNVCKIETDIIENDVRSRFQKNVIRKLFTLNTVHFDSASQNDKIDRAMDYANGVGEEVLVSFFIIISNLITLVASWYVLRKLSIWISLIIIVKMSIDYVLERKVDEFIHSIRKEMTRTKRKMNYTYNLMANIKIVKEIKMHNALSFILEKFEEIYHKNRRHQFKLNTHSIAIEDSFGLTDALLIVSIYIVIGNDLFKGLISIGTFVMYYEATWTINNLFAEINYGISTIRQATLQASNYFEFMDIEPECTASSEKYKLEQQAPLIEFENVYFKYHGSNEWVLKDVSFTITPYTKTIIAGENGAGKSTIAKLMMGLYYPDKGMIKINGRPLEDYDRESLFDGIATVFQDHHEFAFTIAENVLLDTYTEEQEPVVVNALSKVGLLNKVKGLSAGILTPLSKELEDNGTDLSGGERQRLSIARAFAKPSHLLILDEPSSALDAIAEDQLLSQLDALARDKTVVLISHRLVNVQPSDQILFIEKGTVAEYGSHSELVSTNSKYRDMYALHANKYGMVI